MVDKKSERLLKTIFVERIYIGDSFSGHKLKDIISLLSKYMKKNKWLWIQ